jgi:hypothetical protein
MKTEWMSNVRFNFLALSRNAGDNYPNIGKAKQIPANAEKLGRAKQILRKQDL